MSGMAGTSARGTGVPSEATYLISTQRVRTNLSPGQGRKVVWKYGDIRWRIDYLAATPGIAGSASSAVVQRAPSYDQRWSDHAPVTVCFQY
jgi:exodeoxyribonuclease-3